MEPLALVFFLLVVFLGSYVQAVAGFAMAIIIVALLGGSRLLDVPTLAAVTSLLSILNVVLALRGRTHFVDRRIFLWLALGQVPAIFLGFQLMEWLDENVRWVLEICLGLFITLGSMSMMIRPEPRDRVAGRAGTWLTGVTGGVVGGMFGASGPILGWFGYSQPLDVAVIRATLLASFAVTTSTRTVFVGIDGGLTDAVLGYAAIGVPVVVLGTWLGNTFAPPIEDATMKRLAFGLLFLTGVWILGSALYLR